VPRGPYPGAFRLVLVDDPRHDAAANQRQQLKLISGWKRAAPNLAASRSGGNHMTVLQPPHLIILAHLMMKELRRGRE
jgi:hypothetical protein